MARYERPKAGQWVQPIRRGYKLCCCDCGLVHKMDFRVRNGRAQYRAYRDERSTALVRRHMGIRGMKARFGKGDLGQQMKRKPKPKKTPIREREGKR